MPRILAIADDLSGAAEIAGMGLRFGLPTRIFRDRLIKVEEGLTVIDSDSRAPDVDSVVRVTVAISGVAHRSTRDELYFDLVYKKTDSVMRGDIFLEVVTLLHRFKMPNALLVPQNPSRGRTIKDGHYFINGVPLNHTPFANDPDYPARTSNVVGLLREAPDWPVSSRSLAMDLAQGITIGEASTEKEVGAWAQRVTDQILPVGGVDFFKAILEARGWRARATEIGSPSGKSRLFVCGSASAYRDQLIARAELERLVICPMPEDVFDGGDVSRWASIVSDALTENPRALIVVTQPVDRSAGASARIQKSIAEVVAQIIETHPIDDLFLEGGATASAVCHKMRWTEFDVLGELDTGVVHMQTLQDPRQSIFIKPGSYAWPELIWK